MNKDMLTREYESEVEIVSEVSLLSMLSGFSVGSAPASSSSVFIRAMDTLGRQATVPKTGRNFAHEVVIPALQRGNDVVVSLSGMYVYFDFFWGFYVTLYECIPEILVDRVTFSDFSCFLCNDRRVRESKSDARLYVYARKKYDLYHDRISSYLYSEGYMSREWYELGMDGGDVFEMEEEDCSDVWPSI
jgi:hypothetical protein